MFYVKEPHFGDYTVAEKHISNPGKLQPPQCLNNWDHRPTWKLDTDDTSTPYLPTGGNIWQTLPRWVYFSLFWVEQLPGAITFLTITPLGEGLVTLRWRQSLLLQPNWHMTNLRINSSVHVLALNAICHHQEMVLRRRWILHHWYQEEDWIAYRLVVLYVCLN